MANTLFYVHDPMCSWCWGFSNAWQDIQNNLPSNLNTTLIVGGLAPDSSEPMPVSMQLSLQQTWQRIQQAIPGTEFNFDFWTLNAPRRSTYPSCRAVLAAKAQSDEFEAPMIKRIQQAYYLEAKNPSDDSTLIELASSIGCDATLFSQALNSEATQQELSKQIHFARMLGAQGFPSLFLELESGQRAPIPFDYNDPAPTLGVLTRYVVAS